MKNSLHSVLAAVLGAFALTGCSPKRNETAEERRPAVENAVNLTSAQRDRLQIMTMAPTPFHQEVETSGTVNFDAERSTTVLAPISGPVAKLLVQLGDQIKAGEPLAEVNSPDYANAIGGFRKALVTANNLRRIANLDQKLFAADALARRDLEQAQTDAVNAEADRDVALQQLRSIGVPESTIRDLEHNRPTKPMAGVIRSPLTGTVVERLVSPGQLLQAGTTPCFTVADLSRVWVIADIFESQLANVAVGDSAEIDTNAGIAAVTGTVDNIAAILDPNTRSIAVRVVANNPGDVLKKGMYVRVVIRSRRETTGLLVPFAAVLRDSENLPFVYLEQPDGTFARCRVNVGSRIGEKVEITAGLKPGMRVIVDGGLFVQFQQNQ